jgi:hypothetical protein
MPYRHAHWFLLLLFPLTGLAFWPNYFSDLRGAPGAFHVHGFTASLWIVLLAVQSWSIHRRMNGFHRATGYSSFALLPLFTAGGLLVLQTMAVKFRAAAEPLFATFGARLGLVDFVSTLAIPVLFYLAMRWRRKVHVHARYMLVTVFFLIPPILSRLLPALPPLAIRGPQDFHLFALGVHISFGVTIAFAMALYAMAPKHGRPLLVIAGLVIAQALLFETLGRSAAWEGLFAAFAAVPPAALVPLGLAIGAGAAWLGWTAVPPRRDGPAAA